jgi:hypothetical protein
MRVGRMVEESYVNRTGKTTLRQKKLKQQTCDKEEKKKKNNKRWFIERRVKIYNI